VIDDRDFTVATVVAPSAMKAEAEEEAAAPAADEVPAMEQEGEGLGEDSEQGAPDAE
jgi:large subunit ribosomal protein L25